MLVTTRDRRWEDESSCISFENIGYSRAILEERERERIALCGCWSFLYDSCCECVDDCILLLLRGCCVGIHNNNRYVIMVFLQQQVLVHNSGQAAARMVAFKIK